MVTDRHYLVFGDANTLEYNAYIDGSNNYEGAERDIEEIEIPGRNGTVLIDNNRFKNKPIPFAVHFKSFEDMNNCKNAFFKNSGYCRLEDSHHPDEYRIAYLEKYVVDSTNASSGACCATYTFNCMPQRFLKVGEYELTFDHKPTLHEDLDKIIVNPTLQTAKPKVYISSAKELVIAGKRIKTTAAGIVIDSEEGNSYFKNGNGNANEYVELPDGYPVLPIGNAEIHADAMIGSKYNTGTVVITPNWWRV